MAQEPMTGQRGPDEIRRDIEGTRRDMDHTMDEIEGRVSPRRIRDRQTARVRGRWSRVRGSVMGSHDEGASTTGGHSATDRARAQGQEATDAVRAAPDRAKSQTRGNPLAAGLIAFGVGALAGSLLPSSKGEQRAATGLRERAEEPIKQEVKQAAQQSKDDLQPSVERATDETRQSAQSAAQHTKDDAQNRAGDVQQRAQQATDQTRRE